MTPKKYFPVRVLFIGVARTSLQFAFFRAILNDQHLKLGHARECPQKVGTGGKTRSVAKKSQKCVWFMLQNLPSSCDTPNLKPSAKAEGFFLFKPQTIWKHGFRPTSRPTSGRGWTQEVPVPRGYGIGHHHRTGNPAVHRGTTLMLAADGAASFSEMPNTAAHYLSSPGNGFRKVRDEGPQSASGRSSFPVETANRPLHPPQIAGKIEGVPRRRGTRG